MKARGDDALPGGQVRQRQHRHRQAGRQRQGGVDQHRRDAGRDGLLQVPGARGAPPGHGQEQVARLRQAAVVAQAADGEVADLAGAAFAVQPAGQQRGQRHRRRVGFAGGHHRRRSAACSRFGVAAGAGGISGAAGSASGATPSMRRAPAITLWNTGAATSPP